MDMSNLNDLMKQAQKMQEQMQSAQKELTDMVVEGKSGAGAVVVKMNGRHEVLKVILAPGLEEEDREVLADLIAAAFNDASNKVEKMSQDKIKKLTSGLNLPDDFNDDDNA